MRSEHPMPGFVRWAVAGAGLLGLFLAFDATAVFVFLLLEPVVSGDPPNPYVGVVAYFVLPILIIVGGGVAWGAYGFWRATARAPQQAAAGAAR